jgi:SEC-C motif-containing protein
MKPKAKARDCACHSGARYADCCAPFHQGTALPPTPEALMRSRYSAFALGLGEYLLETLSADHPDRDLPREALVRTLSQTHEKQRFLGLRILSATTDGDSGEVEFHARIFERGVDRSFTERSTFVRERGAWRYAAGTVDN